MLLVCFVHVSWVRLSGCVKLKNGFKGKYDHPWETVNLCEGCFATVRRDVVFANETIWLTLTNIMVKRKVFPDLASFTLLWVCKNVLLL